jgi:hypothetical protein
VGRDTGGRRYRRATIPMRPRNAAPGVRYRPAAELQPKPAGRNSGKRRVGALRALRRDYFTFMGEPDRRKPFSGPGFEAERRASVPPAWPKDVDYEGVGARRAERRGACDPDGDHRDGRPVRARSAISRKITSSSMRKSRSSASLNATIRTRRGNFKRGRDRALKLVRREWASAAAPRSDAQRGIAGSATRGPAAPQRRSGETSRRASRTIRPFSIRITRSAQSK